MNATNKRESVSKLMKAWESKNAKRAMQGAGLTTMAVTLAACGGSDDTTTTTPTTPVTPPAPVSQTFTMTAGQNAGAAFTGGAANDVFVAATASTVQAFDSINGGTGVDTLRITDIVKAYEGEAGLPLTATSIEALEISSTGGFGTAQVNAQATAAGAGEVLTITPTYATSAFTEVTVTINGTDYTVGSIGSNNTSAKLLGDQIATIVGNALGDSVTIGSRDSSTGVFTVTAKAAGVDIPNFTVAVTGGASSAAIATTTEASAKVVSGSAVAPIQQIQLGGTVASTDTYTVNFVSATGASKALVYTGSAQSTAASAIAAQINASAGKDIATAAGTVVTIRGDAGEPLPLISVSMGGSSVAATAVSTYVQNAAISATAATSKVVFDATDYADAITFAAGGDVVLKAASTANVTVSNTKGMVEVDGGKVVNVTTTGTGATVVNGKALTSVSVKGGANFNVDNKANTTAATSAAGETLTSVSINGISGPDSALKGAALTDISMANQTKALAVVVTNGKSKSMNLNLDKVGYDKDGGDVTVSVAAGAKAETLNVATASKSQITLTGAAAETLNLSGAGDLKVNSILAVKTVDGSTATGKLTLGSLNSATTTVKTGAGADTFTVAATSKDVSVDAGAGDDVVTVGALVAGASVNLGSGNDDLLASGSAVAAKTSTLAQTIDGGDGNDMVSSALINSGNASRFVSFETLGLAATTGTVDANLLSSVTGLELLAQGATYTNVSRTENLAVNANIGASSTTLTFTSSEVTGKSDAYTVTFGAKGATTSTAASPTSIDAGTLVIEGIENLTIVSGQASGFVNNTIDITSAALKTVVVTGGADTTTLGFAGTVGTSTSATDQAVSLIDASAVTGDVVVSTANVTEAAVAGLTVKTGVGDDQITITGGKATAYAGAGDDVITVANDSRGAVIYTESGKDTVDIALVVLGTSSGVDDAGSLIKVTVKDLAAGDKVDFSAGSEDAETLGSAVTLTATTLDGALNAIAAGSGTTHFAWGVYNGNTYVVHNSDKGSGTDTALEAGDVVLELSGVYDLSLSTIDATGMLNIV